MLKLTFKEFCKLCVEQPEINSTLLDFANEVAKDKNFPEQKEDIEEYKQVLGEYFEYKLTLTMQSAFIRLWSIYSFINYSLQKELNPISPKIISKE